MQNKHGNLVKIFVFYTYKVQNYFLIITYKINLIYI